MGKLKLRGPVPKDHPMFSSGPEVFSRIELDRTTNQSAKESTAECLSPEVEFNEAQKTMSTSSMTVQEYLDYFDKTLPTCRTQEDFTNLIRATPEDFPPMRYVDPMPEIEELRKKLRENGKKVSTDV